jgi:hypothetical protein
VLVEMPKKSKNSKKHMVFTGLFVFLGGIQPIYSQLPPSELKEKPTTDQINGQKSSNNEPGQLVGSQKILTQLYGIPQADSAPELADMVGIEGVFLWWEPDGTLAIFRQGLSGGKVILRIKGDGEQLLKDSTPGLSFEPNSNGTGEGNLMDSCSYPTSLALIDLGGNPVNVFLEVDGNNNSEVLFWGSGLKNLEPGWAELPDLYNATLNTAKEIQAMPQGEHSSTRQEGTSINKGR